MINCLIIYTMHKRRSIIILLEEGRNLMCDLGPSEPEKRVGKVVVEMFFRTVT